jgi:hypothetical protein
MSSEALQDRASWLLRRDSLSPTVLLYFCEPQNSLVTDTGCQQRHMTRMCAHGRRCFDSILFVLGFNRLDDGPGWISLERTSLERS